MSFLASRYLQHYRPYFLGYRPAYREKLAKILLYHAPEASDMLEWGALDVAIANTIHVQPQFAEYAFSLEMHVLDSILR